ncbi:MAG: class I SAM-dependent methyltransferase [Cyanobacteria bacterium P01_H01_bin.121]
MTFHRFSFDELPMNLLTNKQVLFDYWAPVYDCLLTTVFYQAVHQRLLEFVSLPEPAHVLDLGCGTGKLLNRLATIFPALTGVGCDFSDVMLQAAIANNQYPERLTWQQADASQLPFIDQQFAAVFVTFSFLHYPQPQQTCRELARVLQPGGSFYLVDLGLRSWSGRLPVSPQGIALYGPNQREELAAAVGLELGQHQVLLGPVLLSQFVKPG